MARIQRIIGTAERFSISRPGIDVRTAPRTSDWMALDSGVAVERFLASGYVLNRTTLSFPPVSFAGLVPIDSNPPFVEVVGVQRGNPAVLAKTPIENTESGVTTRYPSFRVRVFNSSQTGQYFEVRDPYSGVVATAFNSIPRDWIWFLLRPTP